MTNYVIIGTGVAGIAAAEAIRSVDAQGAITFVGEDPHGFYSRPGLAYYLTGEVGQKQLFPFHPKELKKLNAHFTHGSVVRIHPQKHQVELRDGKHIYYERLLLAVGSSAIPLKVPGANLKGISKLDDLEDASQLVAMSKGARTAVVVGGGITALELAEGLASRKIKVHLLIRTAHCWASVLDEIEAQIVEHKLNEDGIMVHPNSELTSIQGVHGKVAGITLASGEQIDCDLLAYGIGIQPRLQLAREAGIACERGVLVNKYQATSLPDIFAAGDVTQVYDPSSGRSIIESLWSPAREQGRAAGLNMAGQAAVYNMAAPLNVTRLAGLTTTIIGAVGSRDDVEPLTIAHGDSETWRDIPDAIIAQSGFDINHLRLVIGSHTIVGAILMGDQKLSSALQVMIRDCVDISAIRAELIAPNAPIADIVAQLWSQVYASQN